MHSQNPFEESEKSFRATDPCILVIFGATGDLTARKLVPAIYQLGKEALLPSQFALVGFARRDKSHEDFRKEMKDHVSKHTRSKPLNEKYWEDFSKRLFYHQSSFDQDEGYQKLKTFLDALDNQLGTKKNRVFYLSVQPKFFPLIIEKLSTNGLIAKTPQDPWTRVIIEKPFGKDLDSAKELQKQISLFLREDQIYRIDHYLGKETVQNILVFRFGSFIFESLWNNSHIDHVQITVAEDLGIGTRGAFFEEEGLLRDILQNHITQLLTLVAMEPPSDLSADAIRDEKVKVLQSIKAFTAKDLKQNIIRGQYRKGFINGTQVNGYREEDKVDSKSNVETFVALKLFIENWRWAKVPFYLRGGKRLPKRATEIAIVFKNIPNVLFKKQEQIDPNVLVLRIQPNEGISLRVNCKIPGPASSIQPVKMDFQYGSYFGKSPPEAYERLIWDCMLGDSTLFARTDEVLHSWEIFTPILKHWKQTNTPIPFYEAGSWGPKEAGAFMESEQRKWRLL